MSGFKVGDRIKILPVMDSPFVGLEGEIVEAQLHEKNISTLDRYVVMFAWGEKKIFYAVQIAHAGVISQPNREAKSKPAA